MSRTMPDLTAAEGIADAPRPDRLRELGVAFGQGLHLGAPVPLTEPRA